MSTFVGTPQSLEMYYGLPLKMPNLYDFFFFPNDQFGIQVKGRSDFSQSLGPGPLFTSYFPIFSRHFLSLH